MPGSEVSECFSDWCELFGEGRWLAYRKLSDHLALIEKEVLWFELYGSCEEELLDVTSIPEDTRRKMMKLFCAKFGARTLPQLVCWAVFTSHEEINAYIES
jgi:hypothetical protein